MPVDKQEAKDAFDCVDTDKSGYLTFDEIKNVCEKLNAGLSDDDIRNLIKDADSSGDGKLSFEEFYKAL